MCGRYATTRTSSDLSDAFGASLAAAEPEIAADYNMAPTKRAPLVIGRRVGEQEVGREVVTATWGLVPSWAKDRSIGNRMINARSETVHEKPSFRRAFAQRRAIVPADGYYEWYQAPAEDGSKPAKQPFYITPADHGVLALAGLHEFWKPRDEPDAEWLVTFTILTTSAEDASGRLHDRAPLLLEAEAFDTWLDPAPRPREELFELLVPATPGRLDAWPVSTAVNNVRNNGPELIRPLAAE
ncbi:hypothetical protein HMPREF0063_12176 [Aeromicrobium marinum DSM 15272]|uniref:Abasic site processing protein n=1 Tax=Aeromicrobium marinum DSM 15272 TaxID=585531 RepID=E2SCL4_9ACTN|nr:SOS response-associated peptidase [Aeromicrobium marinum]EFQ82967.1 hypothetical protein HMPREF0063_12176 [Aeromicrobium marinum DSM 15272]